MKAKIAVLAAIVTLVSSAYAAEPKSPASAPSQASTWLLTAHAFRGLSQVTFFEAVDKAHQLGFRYIEGRPYKISEETGEAQLAPSAPPEALEKVRKKLKDAGITLVSYYAGGFSEDDAGMRRLFAFGKAMGIQFFVGEPRPEKLDLLDKLANEYGVSVAIHNHPRRPNQPKYAYWDPATIMRMIAKYSKRIGCCADVGHWVRSNLDPIECLKKYQGRLIYVHIKDVNEKGPKGHDVIFATGVADAKGILAELQRQGYSGPLSFEYENNVKDRPADVRNSAEAVRKIAAELGQKVR